jgi:hypothetical protein
VQGLPDRLAEPVAAKRCSWSWRPARNSVTSVTL